MTVPPARSSKSANQSSGSTADDPKKTPLSVILPPPEPSRPSPRRVLKRMLLWVLLVAVVIGGLWTWASVTFAYSTGEWTGYVQTLNREGWVCKTWEGTLTSSVVPGTMPQVTPFTIRNDSVAEALQQATGRRVTLVYEQHRGVPSRCFGNTQSYVTGFHLAE